MAVNVTETAAKEICTIIRDQKLDPETICLRVGVKGGGCSGFSYILDLTETTKDSDEVWTFDFELDMPTDDEGGVATKTAFSMRVVCDPKSYLYLNGTTIDFKDEIMGRGFVFNNPNASTTCGCGSSFSA